jgi:hypothetical protein
MAVDKRLADYHKERRLISRAPNPFGEGTYQHALFTALQIWDEYMSQIGQCCSQDYERLASFPTICARLGVELPREIAR